MLEPATAYKDNWHIGAMCEHLQAVTSGEILRLIINVPPGFAKSLSVCVFWPCWVWAKYPATRWLFTTYSDFYAQRDARRCLHLIQSPWYQSLFENAFRLTSDAVTNLLNDKTGFRMGTSVGGAGTGARVDVVVADDPLKIEEARSKASREEVNYHWDHTITGRSSDPQTGRFVVIAQRLHEDDLPGHLLKQGGYIHFCVPMEFESRRRCSTPIWTDPREEDGQLAWPTFFTREVVDRRKRELGAYGAAGQLQQDPAPEGAGGIFDPADFRYFTVEEAEGPNQDGQTLLQRWLVLDHGDRVERIRAGVCRWFQTVDTALKTGQDNDYTVVATLALTPSGSLCLYDVLRDRLPVPKQYQYVRSARSRSLIEVVYQAVEDRASGTGIIQEGVLRGTPFKTLKADRDKRRRAADVATRYANHMVFHLQAANWLPDAEHELATFDRGTHDDIVDCVAYAGILATHDAILHFDGDLVLWPRMEDLEAPVQKTIIHHRGAEIEVFDEHVDDDIRGSEWWRN